MRFKNVKPGFIFSVGGEQYEVTKLYTHHAECINVNTNSIECFTFGDFVMAGLENGMPDR